jgi:hypothetical protein
MGVFALAVLKSNVSENYRVLNRTFAEQERIEQQRNAQATNKEQGIKRQTNFCSCV